MSEAEAFDAVVTPVNFPVNLPVDKIRVSAAMPWLVLAAPLFLVATYFVGAEQGATSLFRGAAVHEWTHDGRHLLGFPCH